MQWLFQRNLSKGAFALKSLGYLKAKSRSAYIHTFYSSIFVLCHLNFHSICKEPKPTIARVPKVSPPCLGKKPARSSV